MDTQNSTITCRRCGHALKYLDQNSPLLYCADCREHLPFAPRTLEDFTIFALWEIEKHPVYQAMPPSHQQAVRRGFVQAALDLTLEGSDKYWRSQAQRRERDERRSSGRPAGRPIALSEAAFREQFTRLTKQNPQASKDDIAAWIEVKDRSGKTSTGIDVRTLDTWLQRYDMASLPHWPRPRERRRKRPRLAKTINAVV